MWAMRSAVRLSTNAPARLMPRMATATLAIPIAIHAGESAKALIARAGSGTISTAPIAVK